MGVIAVVALIVLGPKELPNALRTVTQLMKTARKLANEFQSGVNEIVREADLEDARKLAEGVSKGSIGKAIEKIADPTGEIKSAVNAASASAKLPPAAPTPDAAETSVAPIGPAADVQADVQSVPAKTEESTPTPVDAARSA
jgi:sec-independent protein translocase protein TatB